MRGHMLPYKNQGSSMENVDLNLDNYSLDDLLSLFSLPIHFDAAQLRQARRVVASSHPDRSHLPGQYFSFFQRAYNLLEEVHRAQAAREHAAIREARGPRPEELEYASERDEGLAAALSKHSKSSGFNRTFNELFEKHGHVTHEADGGHGSWFSEDAPPARHEGTRDEMFARHKRDARALVSSESIAAAGSLGGLAHSDLVGAPDGSFGSSTSSSLPYQDLREAHEISVLPVSEEEDFDRRRQYAGVGQLKSERERMDSQMSIPDMASSRQRLAEREAEERTAGAHRAYTLAQQHDRARDANAQMIAGMLRLTGGSSK